MHVWGAQAEHPCAVQNTSLHPPEPPATAHVERVASEGVWAVGAILHLMQQRKAQWGQWQHVRSVEFRTSPRAQSRV